MLEGKTALITGVSRRIGRGIAYKFAEHGAYVGINYVSNDNAARETLQLVRAKGGDGVLLKGDVSNATDVEKNVKTLVDKRGQIDILVNNAGIYVRNRFEIWNWNRGTRAITVQIVIHTTLNINDQRNRNHHQIELPA